MRQKKLIFLITPTTTSTNYAPTTTWQFGADPYTTGAQKAAEISSKNLFFN